MKILILLSLTFSLLAQASLDLPSLKGVGAIHREEIIEYEKQIGGISNTSASMSSDDSIEGFFKQVKKYKYDFDFETIWSLLSQNGPEDFFAGPKVFFVAAYSTKSNIMYYPGGKTKAKLEEGMNIINWLDLPLGIKMPIGVTVNKVDKEKRIVEIAYTEGNTSTGFQSLHFQDNKKGGVTIVHTSYFRSESFLRDKLAYKPFHKLTTGEFHKTLKRKLEEQRHEEIIKKSLKGFSDTL